MITVFTPAYNRAYIIKNLYDSLLRQTDRDFEWLVVDDGSTDNTRETIQSFIDEHKIAIQYYCKENGGKHSAINLGVQKAKGELFFTVDSDDYLTDDALETLVFYFDKIKDDRRYSGVSGLRVYPDGNVIGGAVSYTELHCSHWDFAYKHNIKGDKAEAFKTAVLKEYPYPEIAGENFMSEVIIVNRLIPKYPLFLFFNKSIYICEYLSDGLTAASVKNRMRCNVSAMLLYEEQSKCPLPLPVKIKSLINYWRFSFCNAAPFFQKAMRVSPFLSIIAFPLGFVMFVCDVLRTKK